MASLPEAGLTSMAAVKLMLAIEAEFGIAIPDADLTPENFADVRARRGDGRAPARQLSISTPCGDRSPDPGSPGEALSRSARRRLARSRRVNSTSPICGAPAMPLIDFAAPAPKADRRDDEIALVDRRLRVREYSPEGARAAEALPGLVYFHGGGWVSGGFATHDAICATLADAAKCRIVAVDYRLAPESRFPAAHEDALAALDAIGADPARWAIDPGATRRRRRQRGRKSRRLRRAPRKGVARCCCFCCARCSTRSRARRRAAGWRVLI